MLKSCCSNTEPKLLLNYKDFKHFLQEAFKEYLSEALCDCGNSYDDFEHIFRSKLHKHAPKKKKWIRGNNKPHVNKALRQAIMKRSRLTNKENQTKDPNDIRNYKKQRNYVVKIKAKRQSLNILVDMNLMAINHFGNCKPYFANKHNKADNYIMRSENGELILKKTKLQILLIIILDPLSITLARITEMMIPYHRLKVLTGLIISSNGIKTTPASRIVFAVLFSASFYG